MLAVAAPPVRLHSLVIADFATLFEKIRAKSFNRLWRGSRNDFNATATAARTL
jgi:hypothetical protein